MEQRLLRCEADLAEENAIRIRSIADKRTRTLQCVFLFLTPAVHTLLMGNSTEFSNKHGTIHPYSSIQQTILKSKELTVLYMNSGNC
eukprot:IDg6838t1